MLALLPGVELLLDPVAEDPVAEDPVPEDPDVGMIEPETAPSRAAGTDNAASIVGSTLRFSRADSFWSPKRTPEYLPSSFRFGATSV
jgi:hypothetical protein